MNSQSLKAADEVAILKSFLNEASVLGVMTKSYEIRALSLFDIHIN